MFTIGTPRHVPPRHARPRHAVKLVPRAASSNPWHARAPPTPPGWNIVALQVVALPAPRRIKKSRKLRKKIAHPRSFCARSRRTIAAQERGRSRRSRGNTRACPCKSRAQAASARRAILQSVRRCPRANGARGGGGGPSANQIKRFWRRAPLACDSASQRHNKHKSITCSLANPPGTLSVCTPVLYIPERHAVSVGGLSGA